MKRVMIIIAVCILFSSLTVVSAEYSIDISGLKQSYAVGEQIAYTVFIATGWKSY